MGLVVVSDAHAPARREAHHGPVEPRARGRPVTLHEDHLAVLLVAHEELFERRGHARERGQRHRARARRLIEEPAPSHERERLVVGLGRDPDGDRAARSAREPKLDFEGRGRAAGAQRDLARRELVDGLRITEARHRRQRRVALARLREDHLHVELVARGSDARVSGEVGVSVGAHEDLHARALRVAPLVGGREVHVLLDGLVGRGPPRRMKRGLVEPHDLRRANASGGARLFSSVQATSSSPTRAISH